MTLGTGFNRCSHDAEVVVVQESDGETMDLCGECREVFAERNPEGYKYVEIVKA